MPKQKETKEKGENDAIALSKLKEKAIASFLFYLFRTHVIYTPT
ncbi:hypothetical protein [Aquirufa beregesia]|nr:hypothetical protein [Aquirufa beregesia]